MRPSTRNPAVDLVRLAESAAQGALTVVLVVTLSGVVALDRGPWGCSPQRSSSSPLPRMRSTC
jgi:hypothetical protein